jgi:hypothetical protein
VAEIGWVTKMQEFTSRNASPPAPPPEHWPSDEELAAYIDGTLGKAESQRITEHLASCEDCYAVYIGAVRFQLDSEPAPGAENVVPFPERRPKPTVWWSSVAALLVAGLGISIYSYLLAPPPALVTAEMTAPLQEKANLKSFWLGETMRGEESEEEKLLNEAAFQVGVQIVNLQVSLGADEGMAAQDAIARILQTLKTQFLVNELQEGYTAITVAIEEHKAPRDLLPEAARLAKLSRENLEPDADPSFLDLGQWTEAGRLAAVSREPSFFRRKDTLAFLRRLLWRQRLGLSKEELDKSALEELRVIQRVLKRRDLQAADYSELKRGLGQILQTYYPAPYSTQSDLHFVLGDVPLSGGNPPVKIPTP